jgi:hypothetical protein
MQFFKLITFKGVTFFFFNFSLLYHTLVNVSDDTKEHQLTSKRDDRLDAKRAPKIGAIERAEAGAAVAIANIGTEHFAI